MAAHGHIRDNQLIDALEESQAVPFAGTVWRVVREGNDPCLCQKSGGRWDDRSFDALYTAAEKDGAVAEMYFHLARGLPIFPSKVRYRIYELSLTLSLLLKLPTLKELAQLGVDAGKYGQLSHADLEREYPRTQDIGETAHFLEFEGIIVPNARWNCANIIVFCDRIPAGAIEIADDHGPINLRKWSHEKIDKKNP